MDTIFSTTTMHPREQILYVIDRIYKKGLTTTSGGNISALDQDGNMWITPSGVDKGRLKAEDMICVQQDGCILGKHKPSSEYPFHRAIYNIRPDIRAIIHAHPPALVAFSIVRKVPDTRITPLVSRICGKIGYAAYELPGSQALGTLIAKEFEKGYQAIIMENHGTVLGGSDMADAYQRFETLEYAAATLLHAHTLGKPEILSDEILMEFHQEASEVYPEMISSLSGEEEDRLRGELSSIIYRACDQGMMLSSFGTGSVRLSEQDFLITPAEKIRWTLEPEDMVKISKGRRESGKIPDPAAWLHQEIYRKYPAINAVIMTQSPFLMAFALTHTYFNVRTIPESWIFLQDVPSLPFAKLKDCESRIHGHLDQDLPAMILQNQGILVTGTTLLQTFDKLEIAEFSAKSLIQGASIGRLQPINDTQVEELRKVFLKS